MKSALLVRVSSPNATAHTKHSVWPEDPWNEPTVHCAHSAVPFWLACLPGAQSKHAVELSMPSCELYLPAPQSSHAADPVLFW